MSAEREIAFLGTAEDATEASVWKAILEGEGIPCLVRDQNFLTTLQQPLPYGYSVDVFVPASAVDLARELLGLDEGRVISVRRAKPNTVAFSWIYFTLVLGGLGIVAFLALVLAQVL